VLRAVSDARDDDLPFDVEAVSDQGGHVLGRRVARQLVTRPDWLPRRLLALRTLRRRVALCSDRLAEAAIDWLGEREG
jgi:hypothetical protein